MVRRTDVDLGRTRRAFGGRCRDKKSAQKEKITYDEHELDNGVCRQAIFLFMKLYVKLAAVLLVLGAVAGCSSLQAINAITPSNTYHKVADLAYGAAIVALDPRWLAAYGLTPEALRGWIGLAGPYDFIPITNEATRPVFFYPDTPPESQPINNVSASAPPALLIASEKDDPEDIFRIAQAVSREKTER